jgi:hypothetical protein
VPLNLLMEKSPLRMSSSLAEPIETQVMVAWKRSALPPAAGMFWVYLAQKSSPSDMSPAFLVTNFENITSLPSSVP